MDDGKPFKAQLKPDSSSRFIWPWNADAIKYLGPDTNRDEVTRFIDHHCGKGYWRNCWVDDPARQGKFLKVLSVRTGGRDWFLEVGWFVVIDLRGRHPMGPNFFKENYQLV